jgi:hypothetical protein
MTPTQLLAAAQRLLDRPDARTAGIWPRAAALLARQALEQGLDQYWRGKGLKLAEVATRPQLICLETYLPEHDLGARANHVWWNLTQACHHHPYELPPSHSELSGWLASVGVALAAMESA